MKFKNLVKTLWLLPILNGCTSDHQESIRVTHQGTFTIKARLVDGRSNGKTEFYDQSGKLTGIINYKDDQKWGICIHYYANGVVSDSVNYVCDKEQGYWRHYDVAGTPTHFSYYYFGLQFGPDLWYDKDTVLKKYYYYNFERQPIVECNYDRYGHLDSIVKTDLTVMVEERKKDSASVYKFFAYLPRVPLANQEYYVGIVDKDKAHRKLTDIEGKNFFIDTTLAAPPQGAHFYLGCELKANDGKFDETILVEAIKKDVEK